MHPDLYYRLSAFTVQVPALRHRRDEIAILLRYSMHKVAKYYGLPPRDFTPATLQACQNRSWPGNLKELETFVKRYLVAGDEGLPLSGREAGERVHGMRPSIAHAEVEAGGNSASPQSLKSIIQSVRWKTERNAIAAALEKTGWNRKAASRLLSVSYRTILYKIEQYEMRAPEQFLPSFPGARLTLSSPHKGNGKAS
jgi:two-component system, NtrC family, response regulator AtoC